MTIYLFESEDINPENIEKSLGLARGDIEQTVVHPAGAVEVKVKSGVANATNKAKIEGWLKERGLPRGKKPRG